MKNKLIGLGLIALAVLLLVGQTLNLQFSVWPLVPIAILTYLGIKELFKHDYESAALTLGLALLVTNHAYHLLAISTGSLILVVILFVIGLSFLTPKKEKDALDVKCIIAKSVTDASREIAEQKLKNKEE